MPKKEEKKEQRWAFVTEKDGITYWRDFNNPKNEIKRELVEGEVVETPCKIKEEIKW